MKYKHGFIVMRAQPLHKGHKSLIDKMLSECEFATIFFGSVQESKTLKNPFTLEERIKMFRNIYGYNEKINVFGIPDIPNDHEWYDFVLNVLKEKSNNFPEPEAYYCGDGDDGEWFNKGKLKIEKLDRHLQKEFLKISATEIRKMISEKDKNWENYVPSENIKLINEIVKSIYFIN